MSVVNQAMLLLLLLAAVGTKATPGPENCDGLNVTIPVEDLHKIIGDWVLVWSVYDSPVFPVEIFNTSHAYLRLSNDNKTVFYHEENVFLNGTCSKYDVNMSVPTEGHGLKVTQAREEYNGTVSVLNETATIEFFETCADCMVQHCKGLEGPYLFIYKRKGVEIDTEKLKEDLDEYKKLAGCLGIPHDKGFIYKGHKDFCSEKRSDQVAPELS